MSNINIKKFKQEDFLSNDDVPDRVDDFLVKKVPFTQICNEVINHIHNGLALAVWVYLLSKPPTWKPNKFQIMKCFDIGEVSYKKTISFLRKCKLVDYVKYRSIDGKFIKTRMVVENGSDFIVQCNEKNGCLKCKLEPTRTETVPVDESPESLTPIHRYKKPPSGKPSVRKTPPLINKDIINKDINKKTTTTEKKDSSGSSFVDISSLEKYGFSKVHSKQLEKLKIDKELISESISNYVHALKAPIRSQNIVDKVAYFMDVMRNVGFFTLPGKRVLTPAEKEVRQQIESNIDDRYGLGF
jgi:hypothetical protein